MRRDVYKRQIEELVAVAPHLVPPGGIGDLAHAEVLQDGTWIPGLCLSPFHFDLPTGVLNPGGTRRF